MKLLNVIFIIVFGASCAGKKSDNDNRIVLNEKQLQEELIKANKKFVENESLLIDEYVKTSPHHFSKTGTGLRYSIIEESNGDSAKVGLVAKVKYKISDLKGKTIYESTENQTQEFLIGRDKVERGLHEGIQKMTVGSKAIIILPSHLAHGLSGDNSKIPPQTALVYDIELIDLKE